MPQNLKTTVYTTAATASGGREGHVKSSDGTLDVVLSRPVELNGPGAGTNPEQLFAAGYAACFHSALQVVGHRRRIDTVDSTVTVDVTLGPIGGGRYGLAVAITASVPNVDDDTARQLVAAAHEVCPYSNAVRGNIEVTVRPG